MNRKLMVVSLFLTTFLTAAAVFACSPPLIINLGASPYATPDRIAFSLSGDVGSPESVVVEVRPDGVTETVAGELTAIEGSTVFLFTPDEPLTVGNTYNVQFIQPVGDTGLDFFSVEIIEEAPAAEIRSLTGEIHQAETHHTCCATEEGGCFDSCGGCYSCWAGGFEYRRGVLAEVAASRVPVIIDTFVFEEGNEGGKEPRVFSRLGYETVSLDNRLRRTSDSGVCVQTVIRDLDGNMLVDSSDCVAADDFPEYTVEEPDFPDRVALCAEPPDNTEDPNWIRYGATSNVGGPDGIDWNGSGDKGDSSCSTTGDSDTGFGLLLLLGLVGLVRRRG